MASYTRRTRTQEKRNIRTAVVLGLLSLAAIVVFVFFGFPAVARLSGLLLEFRGSSEPVGDADSTPPPPPRIDALPAATNEFSVEVRGNTEPGATVVLVANKKQEEVLANKDGDFSYTFSLNDGENTFSAYARDGAGNEGRETEEVVIVFDDDAPELAITKPEDGAEFFGSRERQVVIEGTTEEGAQVNINDRFVVVESDGSFAFATTLEEGENNFTIKSEDEAGNKTETSLVLQFSP